MPERREGPDATRLTRSGHRPAAFAAMRDFDPTYDRCGSNSTHAAEAIRLFMSAMPPIATQSVHRNEASRCATTGVMQSSTKYTTLFD